jgi:periplasmic protein TonB
MSNSMTLSPDPWRMPSADSMFAALASNRYLQVALIVSVVLHGLLLSLHFEMPDRDQARDRDRGLEVVLVNARHARASDQADALAQANLDGGGTTEADERPSTPVPPQEIRREGDDLVDAQKAAPAQQPTPQPVMTQPRPVKPAPAVAPQPKTPEKPAEPEPQRPVTSGLDVMDSIAAIARMEAQIDRRLNEYAKRPRKTVIGARTREHRFAQYLEDWRLKIERVGTLNYPEAARGRLYGSLLLLVSIRADGSLDRVEIQRSSGVKLLDDAAIRIVELAAPFAPFPPDIRTDTDIIEIVRTWTFTNSDQIRAH